MLEKLKNKLLEKIPDDFKNKAIEVLRKLGEISKIVLVKLLKSLGEVLVELGKISKILLIKILKFLIESLGKTGVKTEEVLKKLGEKSKLYFGRKGNLFVSLVLITLGSLTFLSSFLFFQLNSRDYYDKTIVIGKGSNIGKIIREINPKKEIYFKGYLKFRNEGRDIKTGHYPLVGEYSVKEIIDLLETGQDKLFSFTIPEGLTVKEIVAKLEKEKGIDEKKFYEELEKIDFPYPTPDGNFEGYFYPETYFIPEHASEKTIISMMLGEFLKKYPSENYKDKEKFYKKLVLASIIEREAMLPSEKPIISSVFHNRLKIGMQLASDATVNYLYDYSKRRMYYKDLEIDSPYNTYKYKGLPPGPIGNPDKASIDASFNPAQTKYYFFVTSKDGAHHFTRTYKEHLEFQRRNKK